jgi:hypothetical protein
VGTGIGKSAETAEGITPKAETLFFTLVGLLKNQPRKKTRKQPTIANGIVLSRPLITMPAGGYSDATTKNITSKMNAA